MARKHHYGQPRPKVTPLPIGNSGEKLVSTKEIAELLSRSEQTIRKISVGLPHYKIGMTIMYSPQEVFNYLKVHPHILPNKTTEDNDENKPEQPEMGSQEVQTEETVSKDTKSAKKPLGSLKSKKVDNANSK